MRRRPFAVWGLVLNAFVWGLAWWPFRELQHAGLHPLWATVIIYGLGLLALTLARPVAWRELRDQPLLWWVVLAAGCTNVGFNWAVTLGDVVRVVLLFYLMPAWAVLLAWPLLGERPGTAALLRLALALVGVVIVLKSPQTPWPLPRDLADWLSLAGGFSFALTNVMLRRLQASSDVARMLAMFLGGAVMALFTAMLALSHGLASAPPAPGAYWLLVALLLGLAFLAANLGLQFGAACLPAGTTALILITEVVFASVSSVWLGAAQLEPRTLAGGALIVLAAIWAALQDRRR